MLRAALGLARVSNAVGALLPDVVRMGELDTNLTIFQALLKGWDRERAMEEAKKG